MSGPSRTTPKTRPQVEPKPQRRYHPDWHCPGEGTDHPHGAPHPGSITSKSGMEEEGMRTFPSSGILSGGESC